MSLWTVAIAAIHLLVILRVLTRSHRQPASRIAWIMVIIVLPIGGVLAYIFLGEVNIGHRYADRLRRIIREMPKFPKAAAGDELNLHADIPERFAPIFATGQSISSFEPVGGNSAYLPIDSNAVIDAMVADIDTAKQHVHLCFYIWLPDTNGCKVVEALKRAVNRGVKCRAIADNLGSRIMIHSKHWQSMKDAGVNLAIALPTGKFLLFQPLKGRVDLRCHRKNVVIDGHITYCGSQNCADPEFRIKSKYAPWVDAMMRFDGPIAIQNQYLFVSDWMAYADENLHSLLQQPIEAKRSGFSAQVIATGPLGRPSAMPEIFESLIYTARRRIVITTPYYVPDESIQSALCAAAYRGVEVIIIFPERNDSWVVEAASRSYYSGLLEAGVIIYEYVGGLLHTKSITLDGEVTLIGSANIDRRSFELNFENNILFYDPDMTAEMQLRQQQYIESSRLIDPNEVASWSFGHRLWNNTIAMLGPLL